MKSIKITKAITAISLVGVLLLTVFMQNTNQRKRISLSIYNQYWADNTSKNKPATDTKKQVPISTNIIEEEDKIVEDFENISNPHHSILVALSFSSPQQFFDEPSLAVAGLPPWGINQL